MTRFSMFVGAALPSGRTDRAGLSSSSPAPFVGGGTAPHARETAPPPSFVGDVRGYLAPAAAASRQPSPSFAAVPPAAAASGRGVPTAPARWLDRLGRWLTAAPPQRGWR